MNMLSIPECQLLVQDIALEMSRLDKRLGKIRPPEGASLLADSLLEVELPERIHYVRHQYLQPAILELLELAQMAGTIRLESAAMKSAEAQEEISR